MYESSISIFFLKFWRAYGWLSYKGHYWGVLFATGNTHNKFFDVKRDETVFVVAVVINIYLSQGNLFRCDAFAAFVHENEDCQKTFKHKLSFLAF